ncbi:hypothetical protein H6F78_22545 [Coleofasciculus sp. FACHB-64]|nr:MULTISPECIES: hypothetical protein [unclassified Coleofasciculus]MBD1840272.1 hypothetical protein [Coleofasciculus sp. FACHB-501]MBD2048340.1 hypothetical protein [Coleofasciculus sp. FACHB-64]
MESLQVHNLPTFHLPVWCWLRMGDILRSPAMTLPKQIYVDLLISSTHS